MRPGSPQITIVVPCFNAGATLPETLACLEPLATTCEVIVVDDGSTDEVTLAVLDRLPAGVRLVRQENGGLSAARNKGISEASGEFILPLDADDLIDAPYPTEAAKVLARQPDIGIVYCRADMFGRVEGKWNLPDFTLGRMLNENLIFATAMFRRADWATVGGYNQGMRRGREDHDFWLRILSLGRGVVRLDDTWFHYRTSHGSMNTGYTREEFVAIHAEIFRNNAQLYLDNIEEVLAYRFDLADRVNNLTHRYGALESLIERHSGSYDVLRRARRGLRRN